MSKNKTTWDFIQSKMPTLLEGKTFETISDEDLDALAKQVQDALREESAAAKLIAQGCKAYGIDPKYLFSSRIDDTTGEAILVTHGGSKVRYQAGQDVEKLNSIAVTGINPKPKKEPIAGKKKEE
jgi:hypothetical protein